MTRSVDHVEKMDLKPRSEWTLVFDDGSTIEVACVDAPISAAEAMRIARDYDKMLNVNDVAEGVVTRLEVARGEFPVEWAEQATPTGPVQ